MIPKNEIPWLECVPNFSEGKDLHTIGLIRAAVENTPGVHLLDEHSDGFHNRTVLTFVGPKKNVVEGAFNAIAEAAKHIDLTTHSGEHPRMGATDVVPFVPIGPETMAASVNAANSLGRLVADRLQIPVVLYGNAATTEAAKHLPKIRRGGFDQIIKTGAMTIQPDFGPKTPHPTAGVTAIGARRVLVAYNIFLDTTDLEIASEIAKTIRTSSGGLPDVHAMGFMVEGVAQVSMNLLDINTTTPLAAFDKVTAESKRRGVEVLESEIVGLAPRVIIDSKVASHIRLRTDWHHHVLESRIQQAREGMA